MTTAEILWLTHEETVAYKKEHAPKTLRKYLIATGDEQTLREWDLEQMKSRSDSSR